MSAHCNLSADYPPKLSDICPYNFEFGSKVDNLKHNIFILNHINQSKSIRNQIIHNNVDLDLKHLLNIEYLVPTSFSSAFYLIIEKDVHWTDEETEATRN